MPCLLRLIIQQLCARQVVNSCSPAPLSSRARSTRAPPSSAVFAIKTFQCGDSCGGSASVPGSRVRIAPAHPASIAAPCHPISLKRTPPPYSVLALSVNLSPRQASGLHKLSRGMKPSRVRRVPAVSLRIGCSAPRAVSPQGRLRGYGISASARSYIVVLATSTAAQSVARASLITGSLKREARRRAP